MTTSPTTSIHIPTAVILLLAATPIARSLDASETPWAGPCTISREPTWEQPFILETAHNSQFRKLTEVSALSSAQGKMQVTLSSANTFSYDRKRESLADYLESLSAPHLPAQWMAADGVANRADSLFYWFGEHSQEWTPLFEHYDHAPLLAVLPPARDTDYGVRTPVLSLGAGAHLSGVPFHQHGPGFSETLHGAKRWLFYRSTPPRFLSNATAAYWVAHVLPLLEPHEREQMLECTLRPGEAVFFPDGWYHATLNVPGDGGVAVFVSTFL